MNTRLIIIRHGETDYNIKGLFQGQLDSVLTDKGVRQAQYTAERLKDTQIDVIYASPLKRAYRTAEIVKGERGIPVFADERIKEIRCGKWEGVAVEWIKREDTHGFDVWTQKPHLHSIEGGETFGEVYDRVSDFLRNVISENQGKNVVVVSHMVAILLMMLYLTDEKIENIWNTPRQPNTAVNIVEINGEGKVDIIIRGDNSHVAGEDAVWLTHESVTPESKAVNFT